MTKFQYAFCGMVFALMALFTLAIWGDNVTRGLTVISAVLLAFSQFSAQDNTRLASFVSIFAVYIAMVITIVSAFRLLLTPI